MFAFDFLKSTIGDLFAPGAQPTHRPMPQVGPGRAAGPVAPMDPGNADPAAAHAVAAPWVDEEEASRPEASDPRSALQMRLLKAQLAAQELAGADRTGSGLKDDAEHRSASFVPQEQLEAGSVFTIRGHDQVQKTLLQTPGELDGESGIYEYIMHPSGSVTHQRFVRNGIVSGEPNQKAADRKRSLDYGSEEYRFR